jgi:hypothetical protein
MNARQTLMKANPVPLLRAVFSRVKPFLLRPLGELAAEGRLVLKQFTSYVRTAAAAKRRYKDGVVPGSGTGVSPRAERFAIETTIRYRIVGHEEWHQGKTENISGSGVLFRTRNLVARRTRVEMIFALPKGGPSAGGASVKCFGQIVRRVPPVRLGGESGLAANIEEYQLRHGEEAPQA